MPHVSKPDCWPGILNACRAWWRWSPLPLEQQVISLGNVIISLLCRPPASRERFSLGRRPLDRVICVRTSSPFPPFSEALGMTRNCCPCQVIQEWQGERLALGSGHGEEGGRSRHHAYFSVSYLVPKRMYASQQYGQEAQVTVMFRFCNNTGVSAGGFNKFYVTLKCKGALGAN